MIIKTFFQYLIFLLFFWGFSVFGQNKLNKTTSFISQLERVEKEFHVHFSYADNSVKNLVILPYKNRLTLKEVIAYFESNLPLVFSFLAENNIVIQKKNETFFICGNLFDKKSEHFIEGAHITVLNTNIHTISASNGYFSIPKINENQVIVISHIAYPTLYLNSTDFLLAKKCITINLNQKIEHLPEIFVQNYLTEGISLKHDNTFAINMEKSGILPGLIEPDVLKKIQVLPGINSVDETVSNINIRGGTSDENLLLWNGIKMYHSGHFFGLISAFNPYLTKSVTVIKNGTSAQYNDAVSGTVKIDAENKMNKKTYGGAGINLLSADAFAQIPITKKWAVQFSGRRSLTDLINTPTFNQYFNKAFQDSKITNNTTTINSEINRKSDFEFFDYSFMSIYKLNKKHKLTLSFMNVENSLLYKETRL
ncbi:MAG: TonB-dependent receptor plug domain-containing protein [Lutibacter sp.]